VDREPRFIIEDWQHVGGRREEDGSALQFFVIKVSGPSGRWPMRSYILGPGVTDDTECVPLENEVDLEGTGQAFIDIECAVDDPQSGPYTMRLYIDCEIVGDFVFTIVAEQ
jgi:hypothetical protein